VNKSRENDNDVPEVKAYKIFGEHRTYQRAGDRGDAALLARKSSWKRKKRFDEVVEYKK
jgi:hypothetical protein